MIFSQYNLKTLTKSVWVRFWRDNLLDQAAVLSFYFLLSIFPLLIFVMALLGIMIQSGPNLLNSIQDSLAVVLPTTALNLVDKTLMEISRGSNGVKLSLALFFTLWTASSGVGAVIEGLNIANEVKESRSWIKNKLVSLGLTVVLLILIAVGLSLQIAGTQAAQSIFGSLGLMGFAEKGWKYFGWLILLAFTIVTFNIFYIYAPNVKYKKKQWLLPGTLVGVSLWLIVSFGFKLYLTFFNSYNVTYGSVGGVIVLLLWFYLSGIAILIGGEVNSEIEKKAHPL